MHQPTLVATATLLLISASILVAPTTSNSLVLFSSDPPPEDESLSQEQLLALGFDRWIVAFQDLPNNRDEYAGLPVVNVIEGLDFFLVKTTDPDALREHAAADDQVRYVEWDDPTIARLLHVPNDERYDDPGHWGTKRIGAQEAWDVTLGSTAVKVAVVDSGLNKGHEEFAGQNRVLQGHDFREDDDDPQDTSACEWHGTHVTGILGATIDNDVGIAGLSQSSILPVKIFAPTIGLIGVGVGCTTTTSAIVEGLKFAADEGAHLSQNSWGGGSSSSAINDAIEYAHNKGTNHVAAAGNNGPCSDCVDEPWRSNPDKVNIVSSSNSNDGLSGFSSEGPEVTVIAPGSEILSSTSSSSGYGIKSGTSMAAPHVSGSLALYLAENPDTGFDGVRADLMGTAEDLGMSSDRQGAGRVRPDLMLAAGGDNPDDPDDGDSNPSGPTASFSYSCQGRSCDFEGSDSTAGDTSISSYDWDFGDGTNGTGEAVNHTYDANGDYPVILTVTDENGSSDTDSKQVSVRENGSTILYAEDFSDGSAPGWRKSSGDNDLWRLDDECVTPRTPSHQLTFSRAGECDYDVGHAEGWARSPVVNASGHDKLELSFWHFFEVEGYHSAYDVMRVQATTDGNEWATVAQWDARDKSTSGYEEVSFDVSEYASSELQVRFTFDTVDHQFNQYEGWYIDEIEITGS